MTATVATLDPGRSTPVSNGPLGALRRRVGGTYDLDPWGLDADATRLVGQLGALRWRISVDGSERLPDGGPALLVANRRLGWSEPLVATTAILETIDRFVRPVGGIDLDPIGGLLRRFGAIPSRVDDVAAALRAGEMVLVPTRRELVRNRAGHLPIELLEPAVTAGVPVYPVAVSGWELGVAWTVTIGPAVEVPPGQGPRAVGEVAVRTTDRLAVMLDEAQRRTRWHRATALLPGIGDRGGNDPGDR